MFWEFPPHIQGGLGIAGKALCDALSKYISIDVLTPTNLPLKHSTDPSSANYSLFQIEIPYKNRLQSTYINHSRELDLIAINQIESFTQGVKKAHFTNYDAIHAHDWITFDAARIVQSTNFPHHIPIILHIHSTQTERSGIQSKGALYEKELSAMNLADKIITVSEYTKNNIINHYNIDSSKITVIHNAATNNSPLNSPKDHPPTILYTARLESQKSPHFAVEVICAALKQIPEAQAIIAGKGSFLRTIREVIKFKKLDDRVQVLGHVPHDKMFLVYELSDVLILPSASEPFGLVTLEAAQYNIPVIMSDQCGVKELFNSALQIPIHQTTSFKQWVNAITSLLTNKQIRAQQIAKQQKQLNKYTWDHAAKKLLKTLEI